MWYMAGSLATRPAQKRQRDRLVSELVMQCMDGCQDTYVWPVRYGAMFWAAWVCLSEDWRPGRVLGGYAERVFCWLGVMTDNPLPDSNRSRLSYVASVSKLVQLP